MADVSTDLDPPDSELPADGAGAPTEPQADGLTDELAKKYDPERLLKMVSKRAGKGASLDHSIRAKYERKFGVDLGHVRVYTGEFAEEFNRQRNAYAVTIGTTGMILMGGSPDRSMATSAGQALLAHELTHVAQARRGLMRAAQGAQFELAKEEHEHEAEEVEAEEAGGGGGNEGGDGGAAASANASKHSQESKEAKEKMLEKVRDRVFEMAAEAARAHYWRNGVDRRP